jgi:hypothetical protein
LGAIDIEALGVEFAAGLRQEPTGSIELYATSTLTVDGDFLQTGGLTHEIGPANFTILVTGTFTQQGGETLIEGVGSTFTVQGDFLQTGGLTKDTGASNSSITVTGTFNQSGGETDLGGNGGALTANAVLLSGGLMRLSYAQSGSTVTVTGSAMASVGGFRITTVTDANNNALSHGTLDTEGQGSITGDVFNSGVVTLGTGIPPVLFITGNYVQTGAGELDAWIGGTNAGDYCSELVVSGHVTFGGKLHVDAAGPMTGGVGSYNSIVFFSSYEGAFQYVDPPPINSSLSAYWEGRYNDPVDTFSLWLLDLGTTGGGGLGPP